jgi:dienelactone hydrolase
MSPVRVSCPGCGALLSIAQATAASAVVRCPKCGSRFQTRFKQPTQEAPSAQEVPYNRSNENLEKIASGEPVRDSRRRQSLPRRKKKGRRVLWWILGSVGGFVLLVVIVCGSILYSLFGDEASLSPVPLKEARAGFQTQLIPNRFEADGPAPQPPPEIFQIVRYRSPAGNLVAYVTPDPEDGKKHPAIVWAHGGFGGIDDFQWAGDGDTRAFREAGLIVMCPSWRGENDNPGKYEMFYGEVDDAVAAIDYAAQLPYVDPSRVYLGGHSTGGTITLLTVEATDKVRAAFSFGGAPDIGNVVRLGGYGNTPFRASDKKERRLRSAIDFILHVRTPTFYFEGARDQGYISDARKMEKWARQAGAPVTVQIVPGGSHFDILQPISRMIASKILADTGPKCNITISAEEVTQAFGKAGGR